MKKKLVIAVLTLVLGAGVLAVTGCEKKEVKEDQTTTTTKAVAKKFDVSTYTKKVDTYNLEATNKKAKITYGFTSEVGLKDTKANATYRTRFEDTESGASMEVQLFNVKLETSKAVAKHEEKDFDKEKYFDYSKLSINGFEGYEVYRKVGSVANYEAQLFGETDKDGFTTAIKITVVPSGLSKFAGKFDTAEFVKSDDFQYLINTIKLA